MLLTASCRGKSKLIGRNKIEGVQQRCLQITTSRDTARQVSRTSTCRSMSGRDRHPVSPRSPHSASTMEKMKLTGVVLFRDPESGAELCDKFRGV